jgi:hypothetical protein
VVTRSRLFAVTVVGLAAALAVVLVGAGAPALQAAPRPADDGWVPLFNGRDLDGWYTWLPSTGRDDDPKGVFKVRDGMLHILDIPATGEEQEFGYLATVGDYANYQLRFQYRWGRKRFPPRADEKRDSGLLYHVVGPDKVWPRSIECQVQEADTGDFFLIDRTTLTTTVEAVGPELKAYRGGGALHTQTDGRIVKSGTYDLPADWNTVEAVVSEGEAIHIVNGRVNNRGVDLRQPDPADPSETVPLTSGRILFQAEGAEVFYRNIEIKPLSLPASPAGASVRFDGADPSPRQPGGRAGAVSCAVGGGEPADTERTNCHAAR